VGYHGPKNHRYRRQECFTHGVSCRTLAADRRKSLDTNMHMMESLTLFLRATGDPLASTILEELVDIVAGSAFDPDGFIVENFAEDWSYQVNGNQVNFGHTTELLWLIVEACEVRSEPTCGCARREQ
jgi:mannose/cellobiose epimerase-like protein (N-acyl-D-glucosamine 2-epimerase family)